MRHGLIRLFALLATLTLLAACESPEERAERHYQSALSLVEEGDIDRAMVELRNVFQHDDSHREARELFAGLQLDRGNIQGAYANYLRLAEQFPEEAALRRTLAELALDFGNWDELSRHSRAAIGIDPELPAHQALDAMLAYRDAIVGDDPITAAQAADQARLLLEEDESLTMARRVVIDWLMQGPDLARAEPLVDAVLAEQPNSRPMNMARLQILATTLGEGDPAVGAHLETMFERFPEDPQVRDMLIGWYMAQGAMDEAEAFLRREAGADDGPTTGHIAVVGLLRQSGGDAAAIAELERLAEANAGTGKGLFYATVAQTIRFEGGETSAATADTLALLEGAEPGAEVNEARILLAQMLGFEGDREGALAQVALVLEADPTNAEALKLRATAFLQDGDAQSAITDLRTAFDQSPRDADILLLMAEAQRRLGNEALALQRLALAVEVTRSAPRESLIYANYLLGQNNLATATTVLQDALARSPDNLEITALLGEVLLQTGRNEQIGPLLARLSQDPRPEAQRLQRSLRAALLLSQNRIEESLQYLTEQIAAEGNEDMAGVLQVLRIQLRTGRLSEARLYIDGLRADQPENRILQLFDADLTALEGNTEEAIALYRALFEEDPAADLVAQKLYALLEQEGRSEEADEVIATGLAATPASRPLRLLRAVALERDGQIDEVLEIYEALFAEFPEDIVVANNLAAVLSLYSDDPEDLARAETIAEVLVGVNDPAVLDTLGWIQVRVGKPEEAVPNLEAAVRGLPEHPVVAIHLGLAYAAAGRTEEARAELARGIGLAGDRDVAQLEEAQEVLARLETDPAPEPEPTSGGQEAAPAE